MIQLLLNKTTPHFQLLPMSKVDQSKLRIREVPPLQQSKSHIILMLLLWADLIKQDVESAVKT